MTRAHASRPLLARLAGTAALVLLSAALVACGGDKDKDDDKGRDKGSKAEAASSEGEGGGGVFRRFAGDYRATIRLDGDSGEPQTMTIYRSGQNQRFEMRNPAGAGDMVMIFDAAANKAYVVINAGGQRIAMEAPGGESPGAALDSMEDLLETGGAIRGGPCLVAGVAGSTWRPGPGAEGGAGADGFDEACVSDDGILLKVTDEGKVEWEVLDIDRGPQPAGLFERPAGTQTQEEFAKSFGMPR